MLTRLKNNDSYTKTIVLIKIKKILYNISKNNK